VNPPEICPNCGASVPPRARACPACGADEKTGWSEKATADRLGISDPDDFDYDEFAREEFGTTKSPKPRGIRWLWWAVALVLALLFLGFYVQSGCNAVRSH
jgi:RNA polymerase subunit RPABC4/transcription elongation factor Spt4